MRRSGETVEITCGVLLALGVIGLLAGLGTWIRACSWKGPFSKAELKVLAGWRAEPYEGDPYLRGRVVVLKVWAGDYPTFELSELHFELPEQYRPSSMDEVETVITLQRGEIVHARYGAGVDNQGRHLGPEALQLTTRVRIVDRRKELLIAERCFLGGLPERPDRARHDLMGTTPQDEVRRYVLGLPTDSTWGLGEPAGACP